MALKDRARTRKEAPVHGAPCSIGKTYRENLNDPAELDAIHAILYAEDNNNLEVVKEFHDGGYTVSRTAASKHRAGHCRCFTIDKDFCPSCKRHLDAHSDCTAKAA